MSRSIAGPGILTGRISESPDIMERVADELQPSVQLAVVSTAIMDPTHRKSEKEEKKRLDRTDKAIAAWMQKTDVDTLNKALDGKSIGINASGRLFGVLTSDPARLIMNMGHHRSRILGDNLTIATDLMNMALGMGGFTNGPYSREEIENTAQALIVRSLQAELERRPVRTR